MFIFLLTLLDTSDCYYFESNLSLVLLIKVSCKKTCNVVSQSSKHRDHFDWGGIVKIMLSKAGGFRKKIKREGWSKRRGVVYRRGFKPSAQYDALSHIRKLIYKHLLAGEYTQT